MNFLEFWQSLSETEKQSFAENCKLSKRYIDLHMTKKRNAPKLITLLRMEQASSGELKYLELCEFFKPTQNKTPSGN